MSNIVDDSLISNIKRLNLLETPSSLTKLPTPVVCNIGTFLPIANKYALANTCKSMKAIEDKFFSGDNASVSRCVRENHFSQKLDGIAHTITFLDMFRSKLDIEA